MADTEQSERTEEPSQRRLQQARERGQIPRSRELTNFATMIGGSAALMAMSASLAHVVYEIVRHGLSIDASALNDPNSMLEALGQSTRAATMGLLPLFGVIAALVVVAAVALGGWTFSGTVLAPDFSRLSPLSGLSRIFGLHGFSELGKALLKCLVIGGVCAGVISALFGSVLNLAHMEPRTAIGRAAGLMGWAFVWLSSSLIVIAIVDVPLQLFQFKRSMRMTRHEIREELKETDGRPEVKSRIRQLQQQIARRRMMAQVPKADVVIANPTHFAVALRYDPKKMRAPRVLAKGVDLVAQNIRRVAAEHRVPVFEAPKLARALYRATDLNDEIPTGLYVAVAQVLSYIFKIRTLNPTLAARMARPNPTVGDEWEIP
jgi:flagellar biosynthesis protein FlhB